MQATMHPGDASPASAKRRLEEKEQETRRPKKKIKRAVRLVRTRVTAPWSAMDLLEDAERGAHPEEFKNLSSDEVSALLARKWAALSDRQRATYKREATLEDAEAASQIAHFVNRNLEDSQLTGLDEIVFSIKFSR